MKKKCPQCGRFIKYSLTNKYRPFCSKRCRFNDLSAWLDERYKVAIDEPYISEEKSGAEINRTKH